MSKNKTVDHVGVVKSITPAYVDVEILNNSKVYDSNLIGDVSAKIIRVNNPIREHYTEGEEVKVVMRRTMGLKAVWISYVIPLAILMILLLSLPSLGVNELNAGLLSIAGVGVYYLCIWLLRD